MTEPTDRDSEALKPCPFCGGKPERRDDLSRGVEGVYACEDCGACAFCSDWNTRASSADDERAVLAELLRLHKDERYDGYYSATPQRGIDAWRIEVEAAWDRAREVLARREKEGKDK